VVVVARQTQRDSLKADSTGMRYPIPEAFQMPITVRVGTGAGDVVAHAKIRQREDTIIVNGVMSPPTMVVFDDGNRILKALSFDQPTAWLVTQLKRDSDLWDREWVLAQLVKRPTDAAAAAAVADAATSADSPETRAIAATGLSAFPPEVSIPALGTALRDTSARVRAAAADELGAVNDPRALELARRAWTNDSSYTVRAAALSSLARLDTAGRHALLAQGLATPSYRDAIQNAALVAIVRSNDTTFIADIQRLVGDQQLPSRVLGALAARGSAHALEVLTAHLDDSRSWVRGWALAAFGSLEPTQRVAVLQAALPRLTHADTRAAVERSIEEARQTRP
jgi:HEAT repeat protein